MSITFDTNKNFNYIYRYINGGFEDTNYANSTAFDLFPDNAQVGDAIYFGRFDPSWSFHDLTFDIGTPLVADSITLKWEYKKNGVWTEIPNLTDGTNSFQNSGVNVVSFDVPQDMCASSDFWYWTETIGGSSLRGNWIRARITAVSNITEGGRTQNSAITYKDFTITANNETLDLATLQSASDTGGWLARSGVPAVETNGDHTIIRPHMEFKGSTSFSEKNKTMELGEEHYPAGWRSITSGILQIGEQDTSGVGKNGVFLNMHARFDAYYDYVNNFQSFGSIIKRRAGMYGAFAQAGVFKFVDSVYVSDRRLYLSASLKSGSEWTRSVYGTDDMLYLYSGNITIDTFKTTTNWNGLLCGLGRPAVFKNTNINNKPIRRYYSADIDLINCTNIDTSKFSSTAPAQLILNIIFV